MKKKFLLFLITLSLTSPVWAETVYVTDQMKFTLRASENNRSKILRMLPTGAALTVINKNDETGYTQVKTYSGIEGYILTRHTQDKPVSAWYLDKANKQLETLQQEYQKIQDELNQIKNNNQNALASNDDLTQERDRLSLELNDLKITAANAVQLKHQRDELQERVITVERELQQIKREKQTLEDSTNQDWFLYGGALSLFGVILGFVLPKLSWRRKTSNWDTF